MSATATRDPDNLRSLRPRSYLVDGTTVRSWLLTRDHKRIAILYLISVTVALALGGAFAMVIRLELITPNRDFIDPLTYNRMFTLHGVVMVWLFMIPAIPGVFGNFLLPLMLGARDVAFPRLNLASIYIYWVGAGLALWGMIHGGADTGWTFYLPYSTTTPTRVVPILIGVFIIGFSTIITGINFIVTIHTLRAPGLKWTRLPLFVWSIYATSIIQTLATPVLALVLLLVAIERAFDFGIFDPGRGGDPVLFQHLFWFYSHPAVYIMVLPSFAVASELASCFSHKNPFGYRAIAYSSLGIAFVGFLTWGHHMFVAGESTFDAGVFGVLSMLVGIFTAIKVFNWTAVLWKGSISFKTPFAYFASFMFLLVFGGMTGIAVATVSLDVHWHDTYFVVAHFHFIMVGSVVTMFLGALHYWWPKMFGRMYNEQLGLLGAALIFMGFVFTFVPQFLLGNYGMPRRYYHYPVRYQWLHVASTAGASLLLFGMLLILGYLVVSLIWGARASRNPWQSKGFEWISETPPPTHNFARQPRIYVDPHDYASGIPSVDKEPEAAVYGD